MNLLSTVCSLALLAIHAIPAWADLPLTVEDLVTDKGKVRLNLSITHANADQTDVSVGESISIQTGTRRLPRLVGGREVALSERVQGGANLSSLPCWVFTTYKAIDPIFFSVTGGYRINGSHDTAEGPCSRVIC